MPLHFFFFFLDAAVFAMDLAAAALPALDLAAAA